MPLSLQHSVAHCPEPPAARSGSSSSTPLQTLAPKLRPGPRPLGPAIPSAVTVYPTWRSTPLHLDGAADSPTPATYGEHMATPAEDGPSMVTPPARRGDALSPVTVTDERHGSAALRPSFGGGRGDGSGGGRGGRPGSTWSAEWPCSLAELTTRTWATTVPTAVTGVTRLPAALQPA